MKTLFAEVNSPHPIRGHQAARRRHRLVGGIVLTAAAMFVSAAIPVSGRQAAQPQAAGTTSVQDVQSVIGLEGIKKGTKGGTLSVQSGALQFEHEKQKAQIAIPSIEDIFLGNESRQNITGAGSVVKMAIPYGGGRLLSLFSHKVEVMTVEYRDANGGFHGAIFVLPTGHASAVKDALVAQGAKVTAHVPEPEQKEPQKEQKP
jgi:hypothetical protein